MKKRLIGLTLALLLCGCGNGGTSNSNSQNTISFEDVKQQFQENPYIGVSDLAYKTAEYLDYQVEMFDEYEGTYIVPNGTSYIDGTIEVDISPETYDDGLDNTTYYYWEDGIAYEYNFHNEHLFMGIDDGSMSNGYYMNGDLDFENKDNMVVGHMGNKYEQFSGEPATDKNEMERNSKLSISASLSGQISGKMNVLLDNVSNISCEYGKTDDGKNQIILKPKDLEQYKKDERAYNEEMGYTDDLSIAGVDEKDAKLDNRSYELYEVKLILNDKNVIEKCILHTKESYEYDGKTETSDNTVTTTFSKMEKGSVNTEYIKNFFDMYEKGEISEGDTISFMK